MPKPYSRDYKPDILAALDEKPVNTIKGIERFVNRDENKIPISYQSVRRKVLRMAKEGLLVELPNRGEHGQIFYTKAIFRNVTRFANYDGNNVSLREFTHTLMGDEKPAFGELLNPKALLAIKSWMLDVLASVDEEAYEDKNRNVPDHEKLKSKLEVTAQLTRQLHAFLKSFIDADVWSPVARERLLKEFKSACVEEHAAMVDKSWMKNS